MLSKNEQMAAHCVGRHIIGLPKSFAASGVATGTFTEQGLGAQDPSFEVVVRPTPLTGVQFLKEVQKRRAELEEATSENVHVVRLEKALNEHTVLFRVQVIGDAHVSEVNLLRGSSMITARLESYRGQFLAAEERLTKFAAAIKEYEDMPSGQPQGFCLGAVVVTGEYNDESASFLFRDGAGADFSVHIATYAQNESVPLLTRMSGPQSLLAIFDVRHKVLRTGERTVAGMRAQEWLGWAKVTDEPDEKTHKFTLETMRPTPSKTTPSIELTLDTAQPNEDGSRTKTAMADEDAIQLWDSVVSSIRPAS